MTPGWKQIYEFARSEWLKMHDAGLLPCADDILQPGKSSKQCGYAVIASSECL